MNNFLKAVLWFFPIILGSLFSAFIGNFFAAVMGRAELLNTGIRIPIIVGILWWIITIFIQGRCYQRPKSQVWEMNIFFVSVLCYIVIGDISYIHIIPLTVMPILLPYVILRIALKQEVEV